MEIRRLLSMMSDLPRSRHLPLGDVSQTSHPCVMLSSMNRHLLAPTLLLLTIPLAAQTPTATAPQGPAARPRPARSTPPPAGFAQSIVLWPEGAPGAKGTAEGDIPKLFTYPTTGRGPHAAVIVMPGGCGSPKFHPRVKSHELLRWAYDFGGDLCQEGAFCGRRA
jgi:hypothetical protein